MLRALAVSALAGLTVLALLAPPTPAQEPAEEGPDWSDAQPQLLVGDLSRPTTIDVADDGGLWYAEVDGQIARWDPASNTTGEIFSVDVVTGGERGLDGMALAHDFADSGEYFLYYTAPGEGDQPPVNKLVRVQAQHEDLIATVPAAEEHNGGRILVAPDGSVYVGTGENGRQAPAQNASSLLGSILHLTPDGEPAEDNIEGLVHTIGHRNVYGLAYDEETDTLWATENNGWRRDEINKIEPGNNYGYPDCSGFNESWTNEPCEHEEYTMPVATFYDDRAAAPTGAVVWQGDLYWASFNEGTIHRLDADGPDDEDPDDEIVYEFDNPVLDLETGPDDQLYVSTTQAVWRVDFTASSAASIDPVPAAPAALAIVATTWAAARARRPRA